MNVIFQIADVIGHRNLRHLRERWRSYLMTLMTALLLVLFMSPGSAMAWWNADWAYRQEVTIDTGSGGAAIKGKLNEVPVVVRLHTGNFDFRAAAKDGSDLRFVTGDDKTPLRFAIVRFDATNEIALIRVMVPTVEPGRKLSLWMYFGNKEAKGASDKALVQDKQTVLAFDFERMTERPLDRTSYANNAAQSNATASAGGALGDGAVFDGTSRILVPASPSLQFSVASGATLAAWVRPEKPDNAIVFALGARGVRGLAAAIEGGQLVVTAYGEDGSQTAVARAGALKLSAWQHVAVTVDARTLVIHVDGQERTRVTATGILPLGGPFSVGAWSDDEPGFQGAVDEVEVANVARSSDWLLAAAQATSPEGRLVAVGSGEEKDKFGAYLGLLGTIIGTVSTDGWVIIGLIALLAVFAFEVSIAKLLLLSKADRGDAQFLGASGNGTDPQGHVELSPLARIHHAADVAFAESGTGAASLDLIRSAIARAQVDEAAQLNRRMVYLTLAISGGPFLGLLGTVVGVMITFASIAAAGDVNVNTIAPGISAAIATTVAGLVVAIPVLFLYNIIMTRIRERLTGLEVFGDELLSRMALAMQSKGAADAV